MKILKPAFWESDKILILPILLLPISLLIQLLGLVGKHLTKVNKCSIPTICIGNIYLGGTGKTPLCIEIFSILKKLNMNPAFIRKKYSSFEDEVALQKKTGPVYQDKKRLNAIQQAIQNKANVAILDDGFQDFSIYKNLSIICFNEKQWVGNGFTIPSGPLRENLLSLKRANCVIINGKRNIDIENKILSKNKKIKIFYSKYKAQNIGKFQNKKIIAFAGIGNPENFFQLLEENKINIMEKNKFPDHYKFPKKTLENLINKSKKNNFILLTTEKDYMRIDEVYKKDINFLKIELEIENKNELINEIKTII